MNNTENNVYKDERVEFLLEEPSMKNVLAEILPRILPKGYELDVNCFLRPHQGKSDLKKSIPKKVKVFSNLKQQTTKVIIIQDQDSNDCIKLKKDLLSLCSESGTCPVLIRIACRELENWYLGDMAAIEKVYPEFKAKSHQSKAKFRIVDNCQGAYELEKMIKSFQKTSASKSISKHLDLTANKSVSFNQFISGVEKFLNE